MPYRNIPPVFHLNSIGHGGGIPRTGFLFALFDSLGRFTFAKFKQESAQNTTQQSNTANFKESLRSPKHLKKQS